MLHEFEFSSLRQIKRFGVNDISVLESSVFQIPLDYYKIHVPVQVHSKSMK